MPTPHISAQLGSFSETVLMPGDPLRAQYIAENFLEDACQITAIRNMLGYTGTYRGKKLSLMAHGMGIPSLSIYASELIREYKVKTLIRIGTCGALQPGLHLKDIIVALGASTDSHSNRARLAGYDFAAIANFDLVKQLDQVAAARQQQLRIGNVFTTDLFYAPQPQLFETLERMGILAVDMETAGLYGLTAEFGARAVAILTVSDHIRTGEQLSAEARQTALDAMIYLALETAISDMERPI